MNSVKKIEEVIEEQKNNVVPLKPGLDKPDWNDPRWLRFLPEGWGFVCRRKPSQANPGREFICMCFQKLIQKDHITLVWDSMSKQHLWLVTDDFSRLHEKMDEIPVIPQQEEAEIQENEQRDSNRTNPLELVEDVPSDQGC